MSNVLTFELSPEQIKYREVLDKEFLETEIWAISDVNPNRNRTHFTVEALKDAVPNMHNKPIVGFFDKDDFVSHNGNVARDPEFEKDYWDTTNGERILGVIRESDPVELVKKDGLTWVKLRCVLWVNYCYKQVKRLLKDRFKKVSVEITVEDSEMRQDGIEEIKKFVLNGITILGTRNGKPVIEAIPNAHISLLNQLDDVAFAEQKKVLAFAYEKADENTYTNSNEKEECTDSEEEISGGMDDTNSEERYSEDGDSYTIKVKKSKEAMSDRPWGEVDKTALRNKVIGASNFKSVAKSIFLDLREGWQDGESTKLKYPVMCLEEDTAVYNRGALASAKAYAEKNGERKILSKLAKIYNCLDLNEDEHQKEADEHPFISEEDPELLYTESELVNDQTVEETKNVVEEASETVSVEANEANKAFEACDCAPEQKEAAEAEMESTDEPSASSDGQEENKCEECEAPAEPAEEQPAEEPDCTCEKCEGCGEEEQKCGSDCKCDSEQCPENDPECHPDEDELCACKAQCAELTAKCEALAAECECLKCSVNELNCKCEGYEAENAKMAEELKQYSDYEEIRTRCEKAEGELFTIHCEAMKAFAVNCMSGEKIKDSDRKAIEDKAAAGKYSNEKDIENDVAIAIYAARPAKAERLSVSLPVKEESKSTKKAAMTAAERLAAYIRK